MNDFAGILSHPIVALALRATLGGCLIYLGRVYYADPLASFRAAARPFPFDPWVRQTLRAMAGFCLWGGCFIVATTVAVQIFGLHGNALAVALVMLSAIGAWLLLPKDPDSRADDRSGI